MGFEVNKSHGMWKHAKYFAECRKEERHIQQEGLFQKQ